MVEMSLERLEKKRQSEALKYQKEMDARVRRQYITELNEAHLDAKE